MPRKGFPTLFRASNFILMVAALLLGALTVSAEIIPYSWQRFDQVRTRPGQDSTGLGHHISGGYTGNGESPQGQLPVVDNICVGGPLGYEGYFSRNATRSRANQFNNQGVSFEEPFPVSNPNDNYAFGTHTNQSAWGNLLQTNYNWAIECWVLPSRNGAGGNTTAIFTTGVNRNGRCNSLEQGVGLMCMNGIGFSNSSPASVTPGVAQNDGHVWLAMQALCPPSWTNPVDGKIGDFYIGPPILVKTPTNAQWIHVAVVRDDSAGVNTVSWYTNGVLVAAVPSYRVLWTNDYAAVTFAGLQDTRQNTAGPGGVGLGGAAQPYEGYIAELRWSYFETNKFSLTNLLTRRVATNSNTIWYGPVVVKSPENVTVWEGSSAPFACVAATDTTIQYQWQRTNNGAGTFTNIPAASQRLYVLENTSLSDSGANFRCILTKPSNSLTATSTVATLSVAANNFSLATGYSNTIFAEPSLLAYFPGASSGTTLNNVKDPTRNGTMTNTPYVLRDGNTNSVVGNQGLSFNIPNFEYTGGYGLGTNNNGYVEIPGTNPGFDFATASAGNGTVEAVLYLHPSAANTLLTSGSAEVLCYFSSASTYNAAGGNNRPAVDYYTFGSDGLGNLHYRNSGGPDLVWAVPGSLLGKRKHVAFVFDNLTNVTCYVDGVNLGTKFQVGFGNTLPSASQPLTIGKGGGSNPDLHGYWRDSWRGSVDELAIYSTALTAAKIQEHVYRLNNGTNNAPASIASITPSKTLYTGFPLQNLSVTGGGNVPFSYQWRSNSVNIANATNSIYSVSALAAGSYPYSVVVTNSLGGATGNVTLTVIAPAGYAAKVYASSGGAPKAFYPLDETSGVNVLDWAGTHDGVLYGTGAYAQSTGGDGPGGVGTGALRMFGTNTPTDFVRAEIPYYPELNPENGGNFSHEFWFKPDNTNITSCAVASQANIGNAKAGMATMVGPGNRGIAQTTIGFWTMIYGKYNNVNQGVSQNGAGGTIPPVNGDWQHIVSVADGNNSQVFIYVNGQQDFVQNVGYSQHPGDGSTTGGVNQNYYNPLLLGNYNGYYNFPMAGRLSQVAIYDYALTSNDVTNHTSEIWSPARFVENSSGSQHSPAAAKVTGFITNSTSFVVTNVQNGPLSKTHAIIGSGIIPGTTITATPANVKVYSTMIGDILNVLTPPTNTSGVVQPISIGTVLNGNGNPAIIKNLTGTGGVGTYQVSVGGQAFILPQVQDANTGNVNGIGQTGGGVGVYTLSRSNLQNTALTVTSGPFVTEGVGSSITLSVPIVLGLPNTYQWLKNGSSLSQTPNIDGSDHYPRITSSGGDLQGVNSKKLLMTQLRTNDTGLYTLQVANPGNTNTGGFTNSVDLFLFVTNDVTVPSVTAVAAMGTVLSAPAFADIGGALGSIATAPTPFVVEVKYSKRMDPASATNIANYAISGGVVVTNAVLAISTADTKFGADLKTVSLLVSGLAPGSTYNVTVSNVYDEAAFSNKVTTVMIPFVVPSLQAGKALWNYYYKVGYGGLFGGLNSGTNTTFPYVPQYAAALTNFSSDTVNGGNNLTLNNNSLFSGQVDTYASMLTAWVTPTNTGWYEFWLVGDDHSRFYMNQNSSDPDGAAWIQDSLGTFPFQDLHSNPTHYQLTNGTPYFMQVVHTENTGNDFVKLGWRFLGTNDITTGPGVDVNTIALNGGWGVESTNLAPIQGIFLSSYAPNSPVILTHPSNIVATAGTTTNFFVVASSQNGSPLTYQWQTNSVDVSGKTAATNSFAPVVLANYGTWRVKVSDGLNTTISGTATLTPPAPSITTSPTGKAVPQSLGTSLTVTAQTFTGVTNYQWMLSTTNVSGANYGGTTARTLTIGTMRSTNAGPYKVVVNDGFTTPSLTSAVANVSIAVNPVITNSIAGAILSLSYPTEAGPQYVIETKGELTNGAWIPLNTNAGNGSAFTVPVGTTNAQRFFRLRMQ